MYAVCGLSFLIEHGLIVLNTATTTIPSTISIIIVSLLLRKSLRLDIQMFIPNRQWTFFDNFDVFVVCQVT